MKATTLQKHTISIGIDAFRIIASLLVVAIHTSPLLSFSEPADFFLTRILARTAVPFFFMVTGQFLLSDVLFGEKTDFRSVHTWLRKTALLYGAAILLYLPIGFYAGHYNDVTVDAALCMLLFDGTFYHLWYFPAAITGTLLICLFSRLLNIRQIAAASGVLYIIGLLGDSYFGLISGIPILSDAYEFGFGIFSYTRNGFFFAPIFLVLGAIIGKKQARAEVSPPYRGFFISFLILTAEGFTLHFQKLQRHDSMYFALVPAMICLYEMILAWNKKRSRICRNTALLIYILHPVVIVLVRGAAKALHLTAILVDNSLIHYLVTAVLSAGISYPAARLAARFDSRKDTANPSPRGRAWIELDQKALRQNTAALQSILPERCRLMPALKANAYGHGALPVAQELNRFGIDAFCVASASEGAALRNGGMKGEILILGYTHPDDFPLLYHCHLAQTVIDYDYALLLNGYGKTLHVHVGIDTGMHRLGERSENMDRICGIFEMEHLVVDGLYTHLCASDTEKQKEQEYTRLQAKKFYQAVEELKERGYSCPKLHLQSSYGIFRYPEFAEDYARAGIALYGVLSTKEDTEKQSRLLCPVLSLKARVAAVKMLYAGETAGYGMQFSAEQDMKIAVLSIGYADGLPRALSNGKGYVLIHGHKAPIIGRICMDQTLVDANGIPDLKAGDTAVLIGSSGNLEISACDLAEQADTIANEILSRLGARLERIMV